MKSKLLSLFACCSILVACGHSNVVAPVNSTPVVEPPVVQKEPVPAPPVVLNKADLPDGWQEVKGDTWAFGVPQDWSSDTHPSNGMAAVCSAPDRSLIVVFGVDNSSDDLDSYGKAFAEHMVVQGAKLLHMSRGKVANHTALLVVFKIEGVILVTLLMPEGDKIYTMGCGGPMSTFQENMHLCGEIAETLKLKQ